MHRFCVSHLSDGALLEDARAQITQDCLTTAKLLADLDEIDSRRLYLPLAYPSMCAFCVHELHLSEDSALKRIQAARTARRFPAIFQALADGRLHLTAVCLLAPHLTPENAADLLAAAAHRTNAEIRELIAARFPQSEALGLVTTLSAATPTSGGEHSPANVQPEEVRRLATFGGQHDPDHVDPHSKAEPVAAGRYMWQMTVGREAQEDLEYAQALLSHQLPSADLSQVVTLALEWMVERLERGKFAATTRPRRSGGPSTHPRHIPAHVKRAVWERDGGQCTYASEAGRRCAARKLLEFDHIDPVARGGRATVENLRLRCRAHNQHEAERTFGAGFMERKREEARHGAAERRTWLGAPASTCPGACSAPAIHDPAPSAAGSDAVLEVVPWLRALGCRPEDARRAAECCASIPDAPLEERVRVALKSLPLRGRGARVGGGSGASARST